MGFISIWIDVTLRIIKVTYFLHNEAKMMDTLWSIGFWKICVDQVISVNLLMLENLSIRKYRFLGVTNVFVILSSPLYSAFTRATRGQVPAIEICCHVRKITKTWTSEKSQTQVVIYYVFSCIYHFQSHRPYRVRIMNPISYYQWFLHNSRNTCSKILSVI